MPPTSKPGLAQIRRHCLAGVGKDVRTPWRHPLPTGGGRKDTGPGIILPSSVHCSVGVIPGPGRAGPLAHSTGCVWDPAWRPVALTELLLL
jgi:hypothetical protein